MSAFTTKVLSGKGQKEIRQKSQLGGIDPEHEYKEGVYIFFFQHRKTIENFERKKKLHLNKI